MARLALLLEDRRDVFANVTGRADGPAAWTGAPSRKTRPDPRRTFPTRAAHWRSECDIDLLRFTG